MMDSTARLAASVMAARESVRITTLRGSGEQYIALVRGDEVIMPIGPEPLPAEVVEGTARWFAEAYGVDVTRRDKDFYNIDEG